ncbi:hypothetical protein [Streptomyces mexicanus]|uniref:hypothetical protein n=1 Tax=Streptomyces mexicanus TaxID=178566 RepID=UPI00365D580E
MRTALIAIDMVPFFTETDPYVRGIVPHVDRIAGALRTAGGLVAWVLPANEAPKRSGPSPPVAANALLTVGP